MSVPAWAVVDLGFGDAGKGATVDFLVRDQGADLVVRNNGGAQAAHNVITPDGRHHTFSQFGAGTFVPGCRTHLGPRMVLDVGGLLVEAEHLARKGVSDALERLTVDPDALLITPFHVAANRLRERLRGKDRHGSCGIGFGETVRDAQRGHQSLRARDLLGDPRPILRQIQERIRGDLLQARELPEFEVLEDVDAVDRTLELWDWTPTLRHTLPAARAIVFEAAQGVLIDERWGFAPHTTWSDCTFGGAEALWPDPIRVGVTRAHSVRHGPGPFPTEDVDWPAPDRHNGMGRWQGPMRAGPLDLELLRYALSCTGPVDFLALTWLDRPHPASPPDLLEQIKAIAPIGLLADGPSARHRFWAPGYPAAISRMGGPQAPLPLP